MPPDPDHLLGCRAIGKSLGLGRAATLLLIERGEVQTILLGVGVHCVKRSEIARYLADQKNIDTWDSEGGAPAPDRVERAWTESPRTRRRGGERP